MNSQSKLNIVIDVGNTAIKTALFSKGQMIRYEEPAGMEEAIAIWKEASADRAMVASVRASDDPELRILESSGMEYLMLSDQVGLPFNNKYHTPETLGVDRMAAVAGAQELFPGENCLVIDVGTCITYDLLNAEGSYLGGGISPGVEMKFTALHKFTGNLPLVDHKPAKEAIGNTTKTSIKVGVIDGTWAEIQGMSAQYASIFPNLRVILCGGGVNYFESKLKEGIFVAPNLVLSGLNRILDYNVERDY